MDAIILAGGLGTRIRALFPDRPKCLIPIRGKPFLDWQIERLARQGFQRIVLCVGHRAEEIVERYGDGAAWNVHIDYSREVEPMGTAGALRVAARFFREASLVLNGDTYLDTDYRALAAAHETRARPNGALGSLGLVAIADTSRSGQVILDQQHRIVAFREKAPARVEGGLISAGAYILEPETIERIPAGRPVSIETEIFPALASAGALYGFPLEGAFADMGTPEGYAALEALLS